MKIIDMMINKLLASEVGLSCRRKTEFNHAATLRVLVGFVE